MPMTVKTGVKAFSDRAPESIITKDSGVRTLSATDQEKLGNKSPDEILNKLADPNYVDPSKKVRQVGNKALDKDAFMKLMLTQMKHQDPTNPMQAHEMSAQLASFTSLEQLQNLNSTLTEMKKDQAPMQSFEMLNFIGKSVAGDSSEVVRMNGDKEHEFKFRLGKDASDVTLKLRNAQGEVVRTFELKDLKTGDNTMMWNGQDDKGLEQPPGAYQFIVEAKDKTGNKVATETKFDGIISGVNFTAQGPVMMVGQRGIKMSDIRKIIDPHVQQNDQNSTLVSISDLKKMAENSQNIKGTPAPANMGQPVQASKGQSVQTNLGQPKKLEGSAQQAAQEGVSKPQSDAKEIPQGTGNLQQVPMARKMVDKIEKEAGKQIVI